MSTDVRAGTGMRAHAAVSTQRHGGSRSSISRLRSQTPLVLRPTVASSRTPQPGRDPNAACVALATGAAGPVGGDDYLLEVVVGARSTLVLTEVSASLALPGPRGARSRMRCRVRVEEGGTLIWLPQPLIAAAGCRHEHRIEINLADDACLYYRDEILLGRHGEQPGDLEVDLSIRRAGAPLLRQQLRFGPDAPGYTGGAVIGDARAVGSFVIVDPTYASEPLSPEPFAAEPSSTESDPRSGLLRLTDDALMGTAVGEDGPTMRGALDGLGGLLRAPWGADTPSAWSAVPR